MVYGEKINNPKNKLTILIAPLNWGLGHATRCIPIIKILEKEGCDLILAADGDTFSLLKKEFPSTVILRLFDYKIRYGRGLTSLAFKIILQLPRLSIAIKKEYQWLKNIIKTYKPDVVISDNRFGMYNRKVISIYITHQLEIKTGNFLLNYIANKIHNSFVKRYNQCWVPDFKENGLAGELSHTKKSNDDIIYLGALSRFENVPTSKNIYDLLISISGPESQRTIFENIVLEQVKTCRRKVLIVRGLPSEKTEIKSSNPFVKIKNHLSSADLNIAFQQSGMIICRSGYTTVMDLTKLHKQAVLVPTPGQAEQEYLASYLMEKKNFFSVKQKDFVLEEVLLKAEAFPFVKRNDNMEAYKKIISEFVLSVKSGKFAT